MEMLDSFLDLLSSLLTYLYRVYVNGIIRVWEFFKINIAAAAMLVFMVWIFRMRIERVIREAARPVMRIGQNHEVNPGELTGVEREEAERESIRLIVKYSAVFLAVVGASVLSTKAILYSAAVMWALGAVSIRFLPGARVVLADTAETHTLAYALGVIFIEMLIWFNTDTTSLDMSRSLRSAVPPVSNSTVAGYLPMLLDYVAVIVPLNYARLIWHHWRTYADADEVQREMQRLQRTTNGRDLYDDEYNRRL